MQNKKHNRHRTFSTLANNIIVIKKYFINEEFLPVTVAEWSKICTDFARSKDGIGGSNSTQDMSVCYSLFVLSCD